MYGVKKEDKENLTFDVRQEGHKLSVKGSIEDQKKRKNLNCIVEVYIWTCHRPFHVGSIHFWFWTSDFVIDNA